MGQPDTVDAIRTDCWDEALKTFGTAYIFEKRADKMKRKLRWPAFAGIAIPLIIGSIYLSFGKEFEYLGEFVAIAGILGVVQIVVSAWSLVAKWDDRLAYSLESASANYELSNRYTKLAKNPPPDLAEFRRRFDVLEAKNHSRRDSDYKQGVSDKEKRMGMRAGLRQFERACKECGNVPTSMKPTDCAVCGNF